MDITKIKLLNLMQGNLNYLNTRQNLLAQNIANANTPGYEAKDIKRPDFKELVAKASGGTNNNLTLTSGNHIAGTNSASNYKKFVSGGFEVKPSGNQVVLEDEILKASQTNIEYQETTSLYRKMIEMLKTAIGNV